MFGLHWRFAPCTLVLDVQLADGMNSRYIVRDTDTSALPVSSLSVSELSSFSFPRISSSSSHDGREPNRIRRTGTVLNGAGRTGFSNQTDRTGTAAARVGPEGTYRREPDPARTGQTGTRSGGHWTEPNRISAISVFPCLNGSVLQCVSVSQRFSVTAFQCFSLEPGAFECFGDSLFQWFNV